MKQYIVDLTDSDYECPYLIQASGKEELAEILDEFGDMEGVPYREVNIGDDPFILPLPPNKDRNYQMAHFNEFSEEYDMSEWTDDYCFWDHEEESNPNKWTTMTEIWDKTLGKFWKDKTAEV